MQVSRDMQNTCTNKVSATASDKKHREIALFFWNVFLLLRKSVIFQLIKNKEIFQQLLKIKGKRIYSKCVKNSRCPKEIGFNGWNKENLGRLNVCIHFLKVVPQNPQILPSRNSVTLRKQTLYKTFLQRNLLMLKLQNPTLSQLCYMIISVRNFCLVNKG